MTGDFAYDATGTGLWGAGTGKGLPTIFDTFVANANRQVLVNDFANNTPELGSQLTSGALTFQGRAAMRAAGGRPPALFAPALWMEGTSVYHLDPTSYPTGLPDSLMTPSLRPGMAIHDPGPVVDGILRDLGWPPGLLGLDPPISRPAATAVTSTTTTAVPHPPVSRPAPVAATTSSTRSTGPGSSVLRPRFPARRRADAARRWRPRTAVSLPPRRGKALSRMHSPSPGRGTGCGC